MAETSGDGRGAAKLRAVGMGRAAGESLLIDGTMEVLVESIGPQGGDPQIVALRVDAAGRTSRRLRAWCGQPADLGGGLAIQVLGVRAGKAALRVVAPGLLVMRKELTGSPH